MKYTESCSKLQITSQWVLTDNHKRQLTFFIKWAKN